MKHRGPRIAFIAVLLALHGLFALQPDWMESFGVSRMKVWFRDTHAMLAASDSAQAGHDPFVDNPFDLNRERHIYSDWWYGLGSLGLGRSDYLWLGTCLLVVFWTAVVLVVPLASRRDLVVALLVCASPPIWLGVNRANPDLLLFAMLSLVVPLLMHSREKVRLLAPLPIALGTGLKFFPLLAGAVFLYPKGSRRENVIRWTEILVMLGLLSWVLADDVRNYLAVDWMARGQFAFGAAAIPMHYGADGGMAVAVTRLLGLAFVGWAFLKPPSEPDRSVSDNDEADVLFALMGAVMVVGCFFATVGFLYKVVFSFWLLPRYLRLSTGRGTMADLARLALAFLIGLVWIEGITCVLAPIWTNGMDVADQIDIRRQIATFAGLLAWGFVVCVLFILGTDLRRCLRQWRELPLK